MRFAEPPPHSPIVVDTSCARWCSMPTDIIQKIMHAEILSNEDVINMSLTCKDWRPERHMLTRVICEKRFKQQKVTLEDRKITLDFLIDVVGEDSHYRILCHAIRTGSTETVRSCYSRGYYMNDVNDQGQSILFVAVETGNMEMVALLTSHCGTYINLVDHFGECALMHAVSNRQNRIVKYLVDNGSHINNVAFDLATPLYMAVNDNNYEIAEFLLQKGAMVNMADADGITPVHLAIRRGNPQMVHLLRSFGADFDYMVEITGYTALHMAVSVGDVQITEFILCNGPKLDCKTIDGKNLLHIACIHDQTHMVNWLNSRSTELINQLDDHQHTPLYYAVERKNVAIMAALLVNEADLTMDESWIKIMVNFDWSTVEVDSIHGDMAKTLVSYLDCAA